ncbi:MAG: glycosyltransferase [Candidatus Margulisiibacteriota bacterium]
MKISIVIPTYNRKEQLRLTIKSLLNQSFHDFELVVADDGSSDGTNFMVESFGSDAWFPVKYCWHENAGRSATRNMGLKEAEGEIIVFIDDHIILDKEFLQEHVNAHIEGAKRLRDKGIKKETGLRDQGSDNSDNPKPGDIVAVRGRSILIDEISEMQALQELPPMPIDKQRINDPFYTFITNNLSVKRIVLEEVGGFDEDFKNYGFQDSELGYRVRQKGYRFKWAPKAVGFIFACGHTEDKSWERARQVGISARIFSVKHPEARLKVGLNKLNHLLYLWLNLHNEKRINRWKEKQKQLISAGNTKKADKYQFRIKHYYFCKGMFENKHDSAGSITK